MYIHCMGTCRGSGRYFSLLYICEYRGILREVGIGNVYDPHPCYYTLYGCRDILRVREVLIICIPSLPLLYTLWVKGCIEGQGGISNVYDPHYCYYTL